MEEPERPATMQAHSAADGTKYDMMHINAGTPDEPSHLSICWL